MIKVSRKLKDMLQLYYIRSLKPESQNFLDLGLAKPWSQVNLGFKNTDLG